MLHTSHNYRMGDEFCLSDIESHFHFPYLQSTIPDIHFSVGQSPIGISPANSSAFSSHDNKTKKNMCMGQGKKVKSRDDEKPSDVVHVRARRGQATDRHSLAERLRRKKINERIRCLQDIVPGCYKTMGMAVMLDEIINYVQSLQTQIEFLSTRLTTVSAFQDFGAMQRANVTFENTAIGGVSSSPIGLNFGYCPQLPREDL